MGFCSCINKLFLVILNFVIFAVGVAVIALASVVIHKSSEYGELLFDGILTLPIWTLVVGIVITLLGFFGCCGALRESSCMLYTYATIVTVLFIAEVTLGVLVAIYPEKAAQHIKDGMSTAFQKYETGDDSLDTAIDSMQHDLHCCGVNGPNDWNNWSKDIPDSCCVDPSQCKGVVNNYFEKGCFEAMTHELKGVTLALGITAIVLAIIQMMCICIACGLAHRRSEYV